MKSNRNDNEKVYDLEECTETFARNVRASLVKASS
jgi:hypothetical protein